ncbi:MAG: hypothetical protein GOV02_00205 [Candidatus Aenigmarchaeota archaeon]|nr:hypothetical protein [Candidatus Aenigmarchaeota archaeon]
MYRSIALIKLKEEFAYKYRALFSLTGSILSVILLWYLWTAIFASSVETTVAGFTLPAIITYMIISTAIRAPNSTYFEHGIETDVRTGFIATQMVKPYTYPIYQFFVGLGESMYKLIILTVPMLLLGILFFNLSLPANTLAFSISAILGFIINFSMALITGLWAFWTSGNIWGLRHSRQILSDMISGAIIPLSFFPLWLANIANLLPFKAIYSIPLSIYVGHITGNEIYYAILQQLFWVGLFLVMIVIIWKRAEKRVVSQGG